MGEVSLGGSISRVARIPYTNIFELPIMAIVASSCGRNKISKTGITETENGPDPVFQRSGTRTGVETRYGDLQVRIKEQGSGWVQDGGTADGPTEAGNDSIRYDLGNTSVENQPSLGIEGVLISRLALIQNPGIVGFLCMRARMALTPNPSNPASLALKLSWRRLYCTSDLTIVKM